MIAVYMITLHRRQSAQHGLERLALVASTRPSIRVSSRSPAPAPQARSSASPASSSCCSPTAALPFPWEELRRLRSMVIKFAAINLVIGLSTMVFNVGIRIDNFGPHRRLPRRPRHRRSPCPARMTARPRALPRPPEDHLRVAACLVLALLGYWIANIA